MDLLMDYDSAKEIGAEKLLAMLQKKYPEFHLYKISREWLKSKKFIAKAKGIIGDVVIYWN